MKSLLTASLMLATLMAQTTIALGQLAEQNTQAKNFKASFQQKLISQSVHDQQSRKQGSNKQQPKIAPLLKGLGDFPHPVTTASAQAQRYFDQGVVLAFGFHHAEAARSFRGAQQLDHNCAVAHWGDALVLERDNNAPMEDTAVEEPRAALRRALGGLSQVSRQEQDDSQALSARYANKPVKGRSKPDWAWQIVKKRLADGMTHFPHEATAVSSDQSSLTDHY